MSAMGYVTREEGCNGGVLYRYTVLERAANRKLSQKQKVFQSENVLYRYTGSYQVVTR